MGKSLRELDEKGHITVDCRNSARERNFQGSMPEFGSVCRVRIGDPEKNRWTDAWLELQKRGNNISACISHEKGYPSQGKGNVTKCVKLNWLNDEPPEY